uniref:Gag-pol polyprotein n=1 Tax=Solanum tuberosum TaxID=4113 RepID=M1DSG3_SOLTU
MSEFVLGVYEMVVKECQTAMFINDKNISRLMCYAQHIEKEKLKKKFKETKRAKIGDGNFSHARCGKKHEGKCLAGTNGCFGCGKSGNKMRDITMLTAKRRKGKQAHPSGSGSNAPKQNRLYAFQTCGE